MSRAGQKLAILALLGAVALGGWAVAANLPIARCPTCDGSGQTRGLVLLGSEGPVPIPMPHRCHRCDGSGRVPLLDRLHKSR